MSVAPVRRPGAMSVRPPSTLQPAPETWLAADGTAVNIRPICAADLALEVEFVSRLSKRSLYQRLMSARTPSLEELRRFADVDPERELGLIATVQSEGRERQVGVVRYVRESSPEHAEIAVVLADEWQGHGLGTRLVLSLIAAARNAGVRRLAGTALSTNEPVLALGRRLGFRLEADPRSATVINLTLDLAHGFRSE
ncbi:MAG: GNAT family N-acetyltransferase [Burkholderiales bacterium]